MSSYLPFFKSQKYIFCTRLQNIFEHMSIGFTVKVWYFVHFYKRCLFVKNLETSEKQKNKIKITHNHISFLSLTFSSTFYVYAYIYIDRHFLLDMYNVHNTHFLFLAAPDACGVSWARDRIRITTMTLATSVTPDL